MKSNLKRFLSLALALVMVIGLMPMNVFAAEGDEATEPQTHVEGCILGETHEGECKTEVAKTHVEGCILDEGHEDECLVEAQCEKNPDCILNNGHPGDCDTGEVVPYEGESEDASGTITGGMVNVEDPDNHFISTEIQNLNATESVVVKLYSGETHIATTTLQKNEYLTASALSVKIIITGDSSSWKTVWEEGKLSADYVPNKVVLYVDGNEMNSAEVKMIKTNGETAINWADVVPAAEVTYVAQIGETKYETLQDAINACTNGETVKLIADITYTEADVVSAHGGGTGFGKHDASNPAIIYTGGTKGTTDAQNQPSNVNAVLDLNGHTITNNADAYLFLIMDNAKLTFKDSVGIGSITNTKEAPVIWAVGTETLVTIESGEYTTASATGLLWSTHGADMVITGGEFSTTAEDASLLIVRNEKDLNNPNYFCDGNATITVKGGTYYGFNPEKMMDDSTNPYTEFNACADGYEAVEDNGTWTVVEATKVYVAQIGETQYTSIYDAVNAAQDGDTITVIADHKVDCSQVTNLNQEQNTSVLWYIDNDITLDLNGKTVTVTNTITTNETTLAGIVYAANGADVVVTGNGAIWQNDSDGWADLFFAANGSTLTVENGTYTCDPAEGVMSNYMLYAAGGLLTIEGGTYTHTTPGYKYIFNVKNGTQDIVITGGTFTKDPATESEVTIPEGYTSVDNGNGTWTVTDDYVEWIKAELLAGRSVTLAKDIVVDGTYIDSIPAATNGNGNYLNPGIFNVYGDTVTFDLNGHTITYKGHADFEYTAKLYKPESGYANSCDYAHGLFMANAGGNLTIVDNVGTGKVDVHGIASGVYSCSPNSVITVEGGTWTNDGCAECGATGLFLYASHGGEVYITGGTFEQEADPSYLIVEHGGEYKNSVIDFSKTKIEITGGTFVGMNPEEAVQAIQSADNKLSWDTTNVVAEGYVAVDNGDGSWTVKPLITVTFDDITMVYGNKMPEFTYTIEGELEDGTMLVVETPEVTVNGVGEYEITANAYVFINDSYAVEVISGKLTVVEPVVEIVETGEKFASLADAVNAVPKGAGETTIKLLVEELKLSSTQYVGKSYVQNIVIDLNGGTLSSNNTTLLAYRAGTVLTIKNGTVIGNSKTGGSVRATYGGTLVLGDGVKVEAKSSNAIKLDAKGTLRIDSNTVEVVGPLNWLVVADNAENYVYVSAGTFYGGMEIGESANMNLSGGFYNVRPEDDWCVEGYKVVAHGTDWWTIAPADGVITVDGVWFNSWDNAKSSIKKNSEIVFYADLINTYNGGSVAKDFKFLANGGTITIDLNGHNFTSAKTDSSKVTTMTVQYNTTVKFINSGVGGGTVTFENSGYPFVLGNNSKVYFEDGIKFVGALQLNNTTAQVYFDETALIGQNCVYGTIGLTRVCIDASGNWTLASGSLTMNRNDATLAENTLTISKNTTLDLAGHNLTAGNIAAFGNLIDSTDGTGTVTVSGDYYYSNHANSNYLPLYDSENGNYRIYEASVVNKGVKVVDADTLKYGYAIMFNKADAYLLLADMAASNDFSMNAVWKGESVGFTYEFAPKSVETFANAAYEQMKSSGTTSKAITININGIDDLESGDVITTTAKLTAEVGVTITGEAYNYTLNKSEVNL